MLKQFKLRFTPSTRQRVEAKLRLAYATENLRLVKRISALLQLGRGDSVAQVAQTFGLGEQTVRDYVHSFLKRGLASLKYKTSPGRRSKLTDRQRQQLKSWIKAGPLKAGYECACWSAMMVQDLIEKRFGVSFLRPRLGSCQFSDEQSQRPIRWDWSSRYAASTQPGSLELKNQIHYLPGAS